MGVLQQEARTVAVKACVACMSGLLERDRFCRWCGEPQPAIVSLGSDEAQELKPAAAVPQAASYATSRLASGSRAAVYRRVSAPLVNAVVAGALAGASTDNQGRFTKRAILALISIPIWLIIVVLSPLDAYVAVKNLARVA